MYPEKDTLSLIYNFSANTLPRSRHERAFQVAVGVKNLSANAGDIRDMGLIPGSGWLRNSSWASLKKEWQPTSVFLPKESHGQRSWTGYSP